MKASISQLWLFISLSFLVLTLMILSLSVGRIWISPDQWRVLDPLSQTLLFDLRLPRTLLAVIVGASMGLCGAALQGYTRNPLADPALLGISSMAALGAILSISSGLSGIYPWVLAAAAIAGACVGIICLLCLSSIATSIASFILVGVILQTLASSGVALILSLSNNPWASDEIINWLLGSLQDRSWNDVTFALPGVLLGSILIMLTRPALNALTLGEQGARALGVHLRSTQCLLAFGVGLVSGSCVAATGEIGFVGFIVPHLMRPFVGNLPSRLLLPSAFAGAALVLIADIAVRFSPSAQELKLGVAMTLIGAPFFLMLLFKIRKQSA
jgi:iron complex transport system permease protein